MTKIKPITSVTRVSLNACGESELLRPTTDVDPRSLQKMPFWAAANYDRTSCVYFVWGDWTDRGYSGDILYIGKATNARRRLSKSHHHIKSGSFTVDHQISLLITERGDESLLEGRYISHYHTRYNEQWIQRRARG